MQRRILMIPGPTEVDPRVVQAICRPAFAHYEEETFRMYDDTAERLKRIYQTKNDIIILPGSGRVSMEAAVASLVEPGDRVLSLVNGSFGYWFVEMTRRVGGVPIAVESEYGRPVSLERISEMLRTEDIKLVTVVHSETSVGSVNPIREVGELVSEEREGILYMVDAISSLGGMKIKVDQWGIDLCLSASQKALSSIHGLSMVSVSDKAWEAMRRRKSKPCTWVLDLLRWKEMFIGKGLPRSYPVVISPHLLAALHESTKIVLEEGLEKRFKRHRIVAEALRAAMEALGLNLFPDRTVASDTVTAVRAPKGVDCAKLRKIMRERYGVLVAAAFVPYRLDLKEAFFRIGHMGVTASPKYLIPTTAALEMALSDLGYPVRSGAGLEAAHKVMRKERKFL